MIKNFKNMKGMTLLELIIVISIIGIMSSVVIVALNEGKIEKQLETEAHNVVAAVREAQNNALTGKNASVACNAYLFTWGGSNYTVGDSNCTETAYELKNGVQFEGSGTLSFPIPFARLNIPATQQIRLLKEGIDFFVCVSEDGRVYDNEEGCN